MSIRRNVRYILFAVAVLLIAAGFSAEAEDFDLFGSLPKTCAACAKKNPKILFVGNSHTFKHNVPDLFRKLCNSRGLRPEVTALTKGGHCLYRYAFPDKARKQDVQLSRQLKNLLKTKKWDYVVLQDRSYEAIAHPKKMRAAVKELHTLIKKSGARMVLYMTWAPRKGQKSYRKNVRGLVQGPDEYLAKVQKMYYSLAEKYHAALAPVGIAFRRAQKILPGVRVIGSDGLHSSEEGAYLSACVLYATIFGKSPEGISYYPNGAGGSEKISAGDAAKLQALAADVTVRGSIKNTGSVRLSASKATLQAGKSVKLSCRILGAVRGCRVTGWKSSNKRVATVDGNGTVTGHKAGKAEITVCLNNNKKAVCTVTVTGRRG